MKKLSGFTLIESMMGLLFMGLVLLMYVNIPMRSWQSQVEGRLFFDRLSQSLEFQQELAITRGQSQHVIFDAQRGAIIFPDQSLLLPEPWYFARSFSFTYLANGRVTNFSTVTFRQAQGPSIRLVFQLGSGKFEFQTD